MDQKHLANASNGNHLFRRKYIGGGKYHQRGICKGIAVGDSFYCFTEPKRLLYVESIEKIENAKGRFKNEEDRVNAAYEATLVDRSYTSENYLPLKNI